MNTDISLIDFEIRRMNPSFDNLDESERERRLLVMLNYGFVWNPYYKEFENRFTTQTATTDLLSLSVSELITQFTNYSIAKKTFEQVKKEIYWDEDNPLLARLDLWASSMTILYGPPIFIIGLLITFLSPYQTIGSILSTIGTAFIYYWVTYQILYTRVRSKAEQSQFWLKNESLLKLLRTISIIITLYVNFTSNPSPINYILIAVMVVLSFALNWRISKSLYGLWWSFNGYILLEKYYDKQKYNVAN